MRYFRRSFFAVLAAVMLVGVPTAMACPATMNGSSRAMSITNATGADPFFYNGSNSKGKTNSGMPHLPSYSGFMGTDSNTFRMVNVNEQVLTIIGEGKHGLWRIQDNGTIREYLIDGKAGLPKGANVNDPKNYAVIKSDYSSYIEGDGMNWSGWKSPQTPVSDSGRMNFVDLSITHNKYGTKYAKHVPIELPSWYCTMSGPGYPESWTAMQAAFKQPGANKVGPLGKRAGLDIKELYTNVLRLETFPDARSWINVGTSTKVNWEALDEKRTKAEYYFVERPFFNVKYLFVLAVYDNANNSDFRYVRPAGTYYDSLVKRGIKDLKTEVTLRPRFATTSGLTPVAGTWLFGVHHVDRPGDNGKSGGGACPMRGGDWDDYPNTTGGSGWPTQYEEITPLCDGVLVDIKFFSNLDGRSWDDPTKYLPSNGAKSKKVTYKIKPGTYGKFVDPYHTKRGIKNPDEIKLPAKFTLTYKTTNTVVGFRP